MPSRSDFSVPALHPIRREQDFEVPVSGGVSEDSANLESGEHVELAAAALLDNLRSDLENSPKTTELQLRAAFFRH